MINWSTGNVSDRHALCMLIFILVSKCTDTPKLFSKSVFSLALHMIPLINILMLFLSFEESFRPLKGRLDKSTCIILQESILEISLNNIFITCCPKVRLALLVEVGICNLSQGPWVRIPQLMLNFSSSQKWWLYFITIMFSIDLQWHRGSIGRASDFHRRVVGSIPVHPS